MLRLTVELAVVYLLRPETSLDIGQAGASDEVGKKYNFRYCSLH